MIAFENVKDWIAAIGLIWAVLSPAALWWLGRQFASRGAVDSLVEHLASSDALIGKLDRRVGQIEADLRHLPSRDDLADIRATLAALTAQLGPLSAAVRRIEDWLIEGRK